jgi:hypothetical protein
MAVRPPPVKTGVEKADLVEGKAAAAAVAPKAAAHRLRRLDRCRNFQTDIPTCKAFGPRRTMVMLNQPRHAEAAVVGEGVARPGGLRVVAEQPVAAALLAVLLQA